MSRIGFERVKSALQDVSAGILKDFPAMSPEAKTRQIEHLKAMTDGTDQVKAARATLITQLEQMQSGGGE